LLSGEAKRARERGEAARRWLPFGALALVVVATLPALVHRWYDATVDGSIYIITARSLAAGEGYRYLGEPFQVRPPGFSLLLVPFVAGLEQDFFAVNFFVACFGALGVLLLFWLERPRLGAWLAGLAALAVWLNPVYERLMTQVMSDVPGIAMLLACLLLERRASAAPSTRREIVLGAAIGLSAYVRTITILLLPAIALSRLLRGHRAGTPLFADPLRRYLLFAAVAVLLLVPWAIRTRLDPAPSPAEQTALYSYGVATWHSDPQDPDSALLGPGELFSRIPVRARQIASVLGSRLHNEVRANNEPADDELTPAAVAITLLLLGSSLAVLVKRREPAELFVAGSMLALLVYFGFGRRLMLPIFVLTLPAAVEVVRDLVARATSARIGAIAAGAALSLWIAHDFAPRSSWGEIQSQHQQLAALAEAVASRVGPESRLGAVIGAHYSVFLNRPVYSIQVVARREGALDAAERVIERHGIDTVVLSGRTIFDRAFARHFRERYGEPENAGPARIWRLPSRQTASTPAPSRTKVLLVGIDGASFGVMDPLFASGRLPTLAGIAERGVRSVLLSQKPMFSPSIWTTIATGRNRADHGIKGFLSPRSEPDRPLLVSTADRRVPALWNLASAGRRTVGVIGWWVSWPAEPVEGFIVSDRVAYGRWQSWVGAGAAADFTYPPGLHERIRGLVIDPVKAPPLAEMEALADFDADERAELARAERPIPFHGPSALKFGFSEQRSYEEIALALLPERQPDLAMLFLVAVDPVSHTFWHFFRPADFPAGVDAADAARLGQLIPAMYIHDDAYIAELLNRLSSDTVVIVVSDHGFRSSHKLPGETRTVDYGRVGLDRVEALERPVNVGTSGSHHIEGVFLAAGGPIRKGATPTTTPSVLDVAPTVLALLGVAIPAQMPGRVLEEIIDPAFLAANPIRRVASVPSAAPEQRAPDAAAAEADRQRAEQLKALGYVEFEKDPEEPEAKH
jgi:predicted AlkP superfamily phosphohydrolase/phosphomutase/4-amino-4-deoxy-L-arabinose transferase-like glycosyltransferase